MDSRFESLLHERLRDGENRLLCPACSDERTSESRRDRTLSVRDHGDRITYHCWHCGEKGALRRESQGLSYKPAFESKKSVVMAEKRPIQKAYASLNEACYEFLHKRGISRETADKAGLRRTLIRGYDAIGFPYYDLQKWLSEQTLSLTGYKLRSIVIPKKEGGFQIDGHIGGLFMAHLFDTNVKEMTICEGEFDSLACLEAGVVNALSIPHGAINPDSVNLDNSKLVFLSEASGLLAGLKKIVIATDGDGSGKATGDEISRRVGRYRAYRLTWPGGIEKPDANEVLEKLGPGALLKVLKEAKPEDIPGLTKPSSFKDDLMRFRRGELMKGTSTGYPSLDQHFQITPGCVTIVTGTPGSGKSELIDQLHMNAAESHGWPFAMWSRENAGFIHTSKLIEKHIRRRFHPSMQNVMSDEDIDRGLEFVDEFATFITAEDGKPDTIEAILERGAGAVMRYGIRSMVIDPYNYIDTGPGDRQDLQVSDMMTRACDWVKNHEAHLFFVAHPTKLVTQGTIPNGNHISGGANFWNKADFGLTVDRPMPGEPFADAHIWKVRHAWLGQLGKVTLGYDSATGCYYDPDSQRDHGQMSYGGEESL